MSTTTTISNISSQLDTLVTQYKSVLVSKYVTPLNTKKTNLQARINALSTLKTKLTTLNNAAKELTGTTAITKFKVYTAESSNSSVATATATSDTSPGTYTLFVSSVAKSDTVLSDRIANSEMSIVNTEFTPEELLSGEATRQLRIKINGNEIATITVELLSTDTNKTILDKIRDAINNSAEASQYLTASVIGDTASTSRLSLLSKSTGSENAISIEDVTGNLLDAIGLTDDVVSNRTVSGTTTAGYVYGDASNLNAQVTLNGVSFTSSTNTLQNVVPGLTIQLKSAQAPGDSSVQLNVAIDAKAVESNIQSFINAYNSVITYIRQQTAVNPEAKTREIFAGDTMITGLRLNLQSITAAAVDDVAGDYNALFKIGITTNKDGTLTISDSTKLSTAVRNNVSEVIKLFSQDDENSKGIAVKINNLLNGFVGTEGQIETSRSTLNSQMNSLTTRITAMNKRVDKQAEQYREQFAKMLSVYQQAVAQQSALKSLTDSLMASYYYM